MAVFVPEIRHCIVVFRAPVARLLDNVEGFLPTSGGQKILHIIKDMSLRFAYGGE